MSGKKKHILTVILVLLGAFIILVGIAHNLGIKAKISFWLIGAAIAFIILVNFGTITDKEPGKYTKKWVGLFELMFLLLFLSVMLGSCIRSCKKEIKPPPPPSPKIISPVRQNFSRVVKTDWGYNINFAGNEFEGVPVFTAQEETEITIRWIPGGKIYNPEGESYGHPYGWRLGYDTRWKERFRFSWCPNIKPHAVLMLIKKVGEALDSIRQEDILYFKEGEKEIRFQLNPGDELMLYYHDVNDPWYFQRNGSDGSYLRFEVEIL